MCPEGCFILRIQGEKHITEAKDAEEASKATAAAAKDTEGVVAKEAEAVMAGAEQAAAAAPAVAEVKEEAAAAADRAASEQDASTSGRETVPGQTSPPCLLAHGSTLALKNIFSQEHVIARAAQEDTCMQESLCRVYSDCANTVSVVLSCVQGPLV